MTQNNVPAKEEAILLDEIARMRAVLDEMCRENSEINEDKIKISRKLDDLIIKYMRLKKASQIK